MARVKEDYEPFPTQGMASGVGDLLFYPIDVPWYTPAAEECRDLRVVTR